MENNDFGGIDPKTFADNVFGPEDERKEDCFQCGDEGYSIHYKDGLCPGCQQKGLSGRSVIIRRQQVLFFAINSVLVVGLIAVLCYSFG